MAAILIIAGGWWYLNQSNSPSTSDTTQTAQQNTNTSVSTQTESTPGNYVNTEFGISFSHPVGWYCKTYQGVAGHPTWNQTICDNEPDGSYTGDPLVAIDVPLESWPTGGSDVKVSQTSITGQNSSTIKVTVYESDLYPGSGAVEYIFEGSSAFKSFAMEGGYGRWRLYTTPEDVRKTLDSIAQSVVVNDDEYKVSSPVDVQVTPGVSLGSEPSVEVTRVELPKIYISYANLPASQWGMRGENFLYPIPPLKSGGTGSIVLTFQHQNLLPPPGEYYIEVYAEPDMESVVRSKTFNVGAP